MKNLIDNKYIHMEILLFEDNLVDIRLIIEVLKDFKIKNNLNVVTEDIHAMEFLNKVEEYQDSPTPDLILLELNLPRKDSPEMLEETKYDERFMQIPIIILTTSNNRRY